MGMGKKKLNLPDRSFKDGHLTTPGYTFERVRMYPCIHQDILLIFVKAFLWKDTGSLTTLAEGTNLKDGSRVLAKIAPYQSNGSMCLDREIHTQVDLTFSIYPCLLSLLFSLIALSQLSAHGRSLRMIEHFRIPRESGDSVVILLVHPGQNELGRYLPPSKVNDLLVAVKPPSKTVTSTQGDVNMANPEGQDLAEDLEAFDIMDLASFLE